MDRVVRLYQLWSWLPHFRAVAETEHLPTASEALGISASSLSRAIGQLEGALGKELFERDGRTIRLNENGRHLLVSVRNAMRGIDDAVAELARDTAPLPVRIAAPGPFHAAITLTLVEPIRARYPRVAFELSSCKPDDIVAALCKGTIDVCLHEESIEHADLDSTALGAIDKRVACASSHPLADQGQLTLAQLADHDFAAPPPDSRGVRSDGWPAGVERRIGLTVTHMQMGIDACATGQFLTVLPTPVLEAAALVALPIDGVELSSAQLFATSRAKVGSRPREFDDLLAALETTFSNR